MNRRVCLIAVLAVLPLSGCGGNSAPQITVTLFPSSATLAPNATQQFTAAVNGASNQAVTWQVNGVTGGNATVGTISSSGLYTAPAKEPKPPSVNVIAISQADTTKSATALVTIAQPAGAANQAAQSLPIVLGTSGGNSLDSTTTKTTITCCSGTLGSLVIRGGVYYILSNNHVLARSDQAKLGEPVTQPGLVDNNCNPGTPVADLSQFVQLPTGGTSTNPKIGTVDAAIAQIVPGAVDTSGTILELGTASTTPNVPNPAPPASTTIAPAVGMSVAKAGRSSGLTCSSISSINQATQVDYSTSCSGGTTFTVEFDNQVVVSGGKFSEAGDSGSLIVDAKTAQPVALLYAGDTTSTVGNPIDQVLNALADTNGNVPSMVGGGQHPIVCSAAGATAAQASQMVPLAASEITRATRVSNRYATRFFANPAVAGVAVGSSLDDPTRAAIMLYVRSTPAAGSIPAEIEGVRTRIMRSSDISARGNAPAAGAQAVVSEQDLARVTAVKANWAHRLMRSNRAIFGVGAGASEDNPGEAALVLFVDKDIPYVAPSVLDGARTKVYRTDRFRAWGWNQRQQHQACSLSSVGWKGRGLQHQPSDVHGTRTRPSIWQRGLDWLISSN